ncbi:MAG: hypothetical protein CENE_03569 [Candidatus Celerinatantimonas neptuna]|nr:MAG: hypothetical protein CENE_03569 [Candidatus Celerinatantimonas neptuna]
MIRYFWIIFPFVLASCSSMSSMRPIQGADMTLTPSVQQWAFDAPLSHRAWNSIVRTLSPFLNKLRVYPIDIYASDGFSKRAQAINDWLIGQGVPAKNIISHASRRPGVTIRYTIYHVNMKQCPEQHVLYLNGEHQHSVLCVVDYMRWKSMVNPQRMVEKEDMN